MLQEPPLFNTAAISKAPGECLACPQPSAWPLESDQTQAFVNHCKDLQETTWISRLS